MTFRLLFSVLFWYLVNSDRRKDGINDCVHVKNEYVTVTVTKSVPYEERKFHFCWSIPPRCSYRETKYRTQQVTEERPVTKKSWTCCSGYKAKKFGESPSSDESFFPACVPNCQGKCHPFGKCIAPFLCICNNGQKKNYCDIEDDTTIATTVSQTSTTTVTYVTVSSTSESTINTIETQSITSEAVTSLSVAVSSSNSSQSVWTLTSESSINTEESSGDHLNYSLTTEDESTTSSEASDISWESETFNDSTSTSETVFEIHSDVWKDIMKNISKLVEAEMKNVTVASTSQPVIQEKLQETKEDIEPWVLSTCVGFALFVVVALIGLFWMLRVKIRRRTILFLQDRFIIAKSPKEENENPFEKDEGTKACSCLSLEPCHIDDEIRPQSGTTNLQEKKDKLREIVSEETKAKS